MMATPKKKTAARLAEDLVREHFSVMVTSLDGLGSDWEDADGLFAEVGNALEREWVALHGPIKDGDGMTHRMLQRECGYLVGVQVGLHLRRGGPHAS